MIVELANKYRIAFDVVQETVTDSMRPGLRFEVTTANLNLLTAINVADNFIPENLISVKVFSNEEATVPTMIYTNYNKLLFFDKTIKEDGKAYIVLQLGLSA